MTKIKQPKIRFRGYINDWEQIKLGELAEISRGASPRPIQDPKWFDNNSEVGWLRISDVSAQNGRITYLEQKISKLGEKKTRVLLEPHLLLSIAATVGKPVINYIKTGVHDGFLIFYNPQFEQEFMFQWLEMFRPKWQKYGQSGSQVNLNSELVKNQDIVLPNLDEQTKIGEFFKTLDDTIALHQQKLEVTKQFKQTMLKKMFPKNGETTPEIRFKGFTEDWEECKLNDIFNITSGDFLIKSKQILNGKYPVYNGGVSNTGYSNDYNFESNVDGDIIISSRGSAGSINLVKGKYWLGNSCFTLNSHKQEIDTYFILSCIYNKQNDLMKTIQKGTIPSLSKVDILKLNILITNLHEQKLIGEYFKSIDYDINNLKNKVVYYRELKKTMLRKLFI